MPSVTLSGFNGVDFGQIIDLTIQAERLPIDALIRQRDSYKAKDSALSTLSGLIAKLESDSDALNGSSIFTSVSGTSSDTGIVNVTTGAGGLAGTYSVNVTSIARAQTTVSTSGYGDPADIAATGGSLSFTINGTTTTPITISAATSLADLRDLINSQQSGVSASIVHDGTNNKLVITGRNTGLSNGFTINNSLSNSSGTALTFAAGQSASSGNAQNASDAVATVNGIPITSASNSITGAIPGSTVTLVNTGSASVTVSSDSSSLKSAVKAFVDDFNKIKDFVTQQQTKNAFSGQQGPLASDALLRQVFSDLRRSITGANTTNGGVYSYLSEIGIELTSTGELKVDDAKLTTAINTNIGGVQSLLQGGTGINGVFDDIKSRLVALDGSTGVLKSTRDQLQRTLTGFSDRIAAAESRLALRREDLVRLYSETDRIMSAFNQQSSSLGSLNLQG